MTDILYCMNCGDAQMKTSAFDAEDHGVTVCNCNDRQSRKTDSSVTGEDYCDCCGLLNSEHLELGESVELEESK